MSKEIKIYNTLSIMRSPEQIKSSIGNILGKSEIDKTFRKQIIDLVDELIKSVKNVQDENIRLRNTIKGHENLIRSQSNMIREREKAIKETDDFKKFSAFVETQSYLKLEEIRKILEGGDDGDEYWDDYNEDW